MVGFRLSPQQKLLWSMGEQASGRLSECVVRIDGRLDLGNLAAACSRLVRRHEILRTTYESPAGVRFPYQIVQEDLPPSLNTPRLGEATLRTGPLLRVEVSENLLKLSLPALAADARSLMTLARELVSILNGTEGEAPEPLQYAEFSEWQNEVLEAEDDPHKKAQEFWRQMVSVPVPVLPIELRNAKAWAEPDWVPVALNGGLASAIAETARQLDAPVSDVLLACWQTLLWRLGDQPDVAVVRITDGRTREELAECVGVIGRPVPICIRFEDGLPFRSVVRAVRDAISAGAQWEERLDPAAAFEPGLEASALPVGFEFLALPEPAIAGPGRFSIERVSARICPLKASLVCEWGEGSARIRLEYNPELLNRADAERLTQYFERLTIQLVRNPAETAGGFDLLSEAERTDIVMGFNQTGAGFPLTECFHDLFERQADLTPGNPALVSKDECLSYAELNARANQLAHYFREQGVGPGGLVGLLVERSGAMIVALLGILKAGGAYVPLQPSLPAQRVAYLLAETGVRLLVTQEHLVDRLPPFDGQVLCLDRDRTLVNLRPPENPPKLAQSSDLIYIIFTSGSTGTPKGVATRHENVVNYTYSICGQMGIDVPGQGAGLHFANVSTLSADLGNTPIFAALASGGCLHMVSDEVLMDGLAYGAMAAAVPIDVLKIAPSHLRALLASGDPRKVLPLKHLIVGGERLRWELVEQVRGNSRCAIMNHYAPTEATIGCLTCDVDGNQWLETMAAVVPLGRPIANMRGYVLDWRQRPVPVGVPGELYIGGPGLSNGYLGRPEMTAERFLPDPLNPASGIRFYRSGDRARFLPRGFVEFLGRQDDQVKIRGFRVELGEIEAVLNGNPLVKQAAVVARNLETGDQVLCAYVLAADGLSGQAIREYLGQYLPEYMVPPNVVFLDAFPLNANGKIDRRALAARELATAAGPGPAAGSEVERELTAIWQEVLGRQEIGVEDNFFDLGGHSLMATLVISRVRARFEVQVPLRKLFEAPTISTFAKVIAECLREAQEADELAQILSEVEGLSEEEARRLLENGI